MKLYDHPLSPYAIKVRIALYEKGLDFEKCEIHTHAQGEALRRLNPRAEVPALVDGDHVICDSKVILAYLEETHPEPALLPKDPAARAECRLLELRCDTEVDAAVLLYSIFKFFRPGLGDEHPEALRKAEDSVRAHFAALDRGLEGRSYLLGDFSLADVALAPHVIGSSFLGLAPGEDTPHLAAWAARMGERPSVERARQEGLASLGQMGQAAEGERAFFDPGRLHWRSDRIEQALRVGLGGWLLEDLAADRAFLPPGP